MRKIILSFALISVLISCDNKPSKKSFNYPQTIKDTSVVDDYFGVTVKDPYRWLEDDNSDETKKWVEAQNKISFNYLAEIPQRKPIKKRLTELWNYEKQTSAWRKGPFLYYYKNDGIQNQSVLYIQDTLGGDAKTLINPNTFSEDGTTSLAGLGTSEKGKYVAYMISKAGSDWREIFVKDIASGKLLEDHIEWVKFSGINWQGNGFYYARYDAPKVGGEYSASNTNHKVYYHKIGTLQAEDILVKKDDDHPNWNFGISTTSDQSFETLFTSESTSGYQLAYRKKGEAEFISLDNTFDFEYSVIDNIGDKLLIKTSNGAPKYRLILVDTKNPTAENWITIIPEKETVLQNVYLVGGKIIVKYLEDVQTKLYIYDIDGKELGEIELPGFGIVKEFNGSSEDNFVYYSFENYYTPRSNYKLDLNTLKSELIWKPLIDFDSKDYTSEQIFYSSKDGTKVPMFITYKKGTKLDGNNPLFMYGYGGFNISKVPTFGIENTVFLENGGIYVVPSIRGGGEYGEHWHKTGTKLQKQNVFDDFIAACEYLIDNKYTSSEKLAVHGRSNGGLLIGAVMTQRPDLFKVCLPKVGVLDMLRYHKFTIGRAWAVDYGLSEDEEQFKNLYKYSPLHNVKPIEYPATMIMTADHDDRVVPAHSFKFAATMQENQQGDNPMLIRIDVNAGHGAGKPVAMQIDEFGDTWAFVFYNLGMNINNNK
jgi:prolyl oligopeptidase